MKVQPFTDERQIAKIEKLLADNPRNLLLFVIAINSGIRICDLLNLKVSDILNVSVGDKINIIEKKTKNENYILINNSIYASINTYLKRYSDIQPTNYLFTSRKGVNMKLTTLSVNHMVKDWAFKCHIEGNWGCHSLRKTFCYFQRVKYNISWPLLAKRLNHSSQKITMRYLGISEKEIDDMLMNDI